MPADQQLRRGAAGHIRHVHVVTERVAVIAVEGHAPAVVGPHRAAVDEGPVGELTHVAAAAVVVHLRVLIASLILQEHEAAAAARRARPLDRVLVEGELLTHAERGGNAVQLLAVAEARRDQQSPVGEPVEERRLPRLLVALEPRHERRIRERNALEHEIAELAVRRGRLLGERGGCAQRGDTRCGAYGERRREGALIGHASKLAYRLRCVHSRHAIRDAAHRSTFP